ncbi:glycosyltransferase family 2 protein [Bradyrhizobium sp.]|uniref:glycosyltransferase family 2 protein n=1 Tax=Bradyrhizobium sp. TaxID=376 RepID=UPI002D597A30|nr:glycosyltransferase family 2 protein [Bradyrhizobium sp.]HZR74522.1 glycosyltransferase family 2 protein [Bradyrhizobium sp.]
MKRLSAIATENGTKARAAEPKPVLNDIRPDNAVHLRNLTLLVCIVCGAGRRKHCKGFACWRLKFRSKDHPMPSELSVSIIVPTLNEEKYIGRAIRSLIAGCEHLDYELIVLDGGSMDRTSAIVSEMAALNSRIRLQPNPARYQSAAVNSGARIAKPDSSVLVRADAHAEYPPGFVDGLARELRERDVASVVVPLFTRGISFLQRGVAMAQNSRLGNGGSPHRSASRSRFVEHGHHACFDRKAFLAVGGYDEDFTHNEDAELDVRLRNSGAKIWLCSELGIVYFPRASFAGLAKQYFNFGSGRARTMLKHRRLPKLRQVLPLGALGLNVVSLASGLGLGWPFLLPGLAYVGACLTGGLWLALSGRDPAGCAAGPAAIVMHQSWAAGFVYRTLRFSTFKASRLPASAEAVR